jgi:hypothetical protein
MIQAWPRELRNTYYTILNNTINKEGKEGKEGIKI